MRVRSSLLLAALFGPCPLMWSENFPSEVTFIWDIGDQHYDMEAEDSFGRHAERGGTFDDSDRFSLRYLLDMNPSRVTSGMFGGGEIAYGDYDSDHLRWESLAFSGIFGWFIRPSPRWRANLHARIGFAFDDADISVSFFKNSDIDSAVLSYGLTGLQYAVGVEGEFMLGPQVVLTLMGGYQGEYASAVSWMYSYDYPDSYIEVQTYGPILAAGIGAKF